MTGRGGFEAWSAALDDEHFAAALAALGVLVALDRDAGARRTTLAGRAAAVNAARTDDEASVALAELLRTVQHGKAAASIALDWRVPPAPDATRKPPAGLRQWPDAERLAGAWQVFSSKGPALRLAVRQGASQARALDFAALLSRSGAGLDGVYVAAAWKHEPTAWRWPIRIGALPGDPLGEGLAALLPKDDAVARFVTDPAAEACVEVLALGEPPPRALARANGCTPSPRCALALVAEADGGPPSRSAPSLRKLAARLQAGGVALAPCDSVERLAELLSDFVSEMLRGRPLDVALTRSLGAGAVAWLDPRLIDASRRLEAAMAGPRTGGARPPAKSAPAPTPTPAPTPASAPATRARATSAEAASNRDSLLDRRFGAPSQPRDPRQVFEHLRRRSMQASPGATRERMLEAVRKQVAARSRHAGEGPARHLQQRSMRRVGRASKDIRDGYVVGEAVRLLVRIGSPADADWNSAPRPFPEHELPKDRDEHSLQVVVHEPQQFDEPMLRELVLPRSGPSSEAEFLFRPRRAGEFDARISVLHNGRVLQTARLRTSVVAQRSQLASAGGIALLDETQVRHDWSDLGRRRRFDLAMVLNHTADGLPRLTAVAERRAWATNLDGIRDPLLQLNAALSDAARSVADHADGLDQGENPQLLVRLARIGADLYSALCLDQLVELTEGGFDPRADTLTHIQVVSARADAVVPIEFFYDLPPPAADAKRVCPRYREALRSGRCPQDCEGRADPAAHVCPMGFWGLRKVIERHVYSPRLGRPDDAELVIQAEPAAGRDRIELGRCAVLGFSRQVPKTASAPLLELLSARFADATLEAADWKAWKQAIGQHKPALLVAFPHNEGRQQDIRLEIGGDFLSTLRLARDYVRPEGAAPPLVFLLGCDVAGTAESFSNHVRYFRQAGAAAVISTTAAVFGEHAVAVGSKILSRLLRAGGEDADQLGELILDARREALLDSLPMALCIVAFGDADWRL